MSSTTLVVVLIAFLVLAPFLAGVINQLLVPVVVIVAVLLIGRLVWLYTHL